jgi:hypothetical protein
VSPCAGDQLQQPRPLGQRNIRRVMGCTADQRLWGALAGMSPSSVGTSTCCGRERCPMIRLDVCGTWRKCHSPRSSRRRGTGLQRIVSPGVSTDGHELIMTPCGVCTSGTRSRLSCMTSGVLGVPGERAFLEAVPRGECWRLGCPEGRLPSRTGKQFRQCGSDARDHPWQVEAAALAGRDGGSGACRWSRSRGPGARVCSSEDSRWGDSCPPAS